MYRRILLTHDGSDLASAVVPHATELARIAGAEVVLLRVTESVGQTFARISGGWLPNGGAAAEVAAEETKRHDVEAVEQLEQLRSELHQRGVARVSIEVVEGVPGPAIVETAQQRGCDLIMMSTHGRSGVGRALLGSVADYVVRHSPVPVLLVRAASED